MLSRSGVSKHPYALPDSGKNAYFLPCKYDVGGVFIDAL
jgi:hypothetical protein